MRKKQLNFMAVDRAKWFLQAVMIYCTSDVTNADVREALLPLSISSVSCMTR